MEKIYLTKTVSQYISNKQFSEFVGNCLAKFLSQDWGDLCDEDLETNNYNYSNNGFILAQYNLPDDLKNYRQAGDATACLWINRDGEGACTILFPSDY